MVASNVKNGMWSIERGVRTCSPHIFVLQYTRH